MNIKSFTLCCTLGSLFLSQGFSEETATASTASPSIASPSTAWKKSLKDLEEGNKRFVTDTREHGRELTQKRLNLVSGQNPKAIIVSCADSRVVPELIFDQCIGDLFVTRSAGNVVDGVLEDSVEFAAKYLNSPLIVVLGHENCGAVKATIDGKADSMGLDHVGALILPSVSVIKNLDLSESEKLKKVTVANARDVKSRIERSPIVQELIQSGQVRIIVAYYSLGSGHVDFYDVDGLQEQPAELL